jgi:hypothetical protein
MTVRIAALWVLGVVLVIPCLPFVCWGIFSMARVVADLCCERYSTAHGAVMFGIYMGTIPAIQISACAYLFWRDGRWPKRSAAEAEITAGKRSATLFENRSFKARSGAELQATRKAAAERFTAIAMKYVPEGYRIEYRKNLGLTGRCSVARKIIQAPRPVTRRSLYIFLHECAHAHLHEWASTKPTHLKEMEAEQWAHAKMREHGVPVPRSMTESGKQYVARKIQEERRIRSPPNWRRNSCACIGLSRRGPV